MTINLSKLQPGAISLIRREADRQCRVSSFITNLVASIVSIVSIGSFHILSPWLPGSPHLLHNPTLSELQCSLYLIWGCRGWCLSQDSFSLSDPFWWLGSEEADNRSAHITRDLSTNIITWQKVEPARSASLSWLQEFNLGISLLSVAAMPGQVPGCVIFHTFKYINQIWTFLVNFSQAGSQPSGRWVICYMTC